MTFVQPHSLEEAVVLKESAPITDLVLALNQVPWVFIRIFGQVTGIVRRGGFQGPPLRMWVFRKVTVNEARFQALI